MFLNSKSYIDKFRLDFIYTSAFVESNTYDKLDIQALIEYGRTADVKNIVMLK